MNASPAIRLMRMLLLLSLAAMTGCLVIPVKEGNATSGRKVESGETAGWRVGQTSRRQVREQLGEPYAEFRDLGVAVYDWVVVSSVMPWMLPGPYTAKAGVLDVRQEHLLLVAFDEADKLRKFELVHHHAGRVRARAERWLGSKGAAKLTQGSDALHAADRSGRGMASICIYRPGGWSEGINPFLVRVLLDGKLVAELGRDSFTWIRVPPGRHTLSCWMRAHPEDASASLSFTLAANQVRYAGLNIVSGRGSTTLDLVPASTQAAEVAIRGMKREPTVDAGGGP